MRRRSRFSKIETELFPFLSVLACTIGTLILLIIVISTETLSDSPEVTIIAESEDGTNQRKQPRYLECRQDGVVIYPEQIFVPLSQLKQPDSDSPLLKLIAQVRENRDREYVAVDF